MPRKSRPPAAEFAQEGKSQTGSEAVLRLVAGAPMPISHTMPGRPERLFVNDAFTRVYGWTVEDVPDQTAWFEKLYPCEERRREAIARWEASFAKAIAEGTDVPVSQYTIRAKDGSDRTVEVSAAIIGDVVLGIFLDLTERNRTARLVAELRAQLDHAGRISALGQLAASLAHELEQPLGAIFNNATTAVEILQKLDSPHAPELRTILEEILDDDVRAGAILDRIRSMVRKRKPRSEPVDAVSAVDEVLLLVGPAASSHAIELRVAPAPGLPAVAVDAVLFQQALLNVLLNSIDALRGRPNPTVRVDFEAKPRGFVAVSVADNGGGVPLDEEPRLLEPFHSTKSNGLGMGLPIVHSILEEAGGALRIVNSPGEGFLVQLELPVWTGGTA